MVGPEARRSRGCPALAWRLFRARTVAEHPQAPELHADVREARIEPDVGGERPFPLQVDGDYIGDFEARASASTRARCAVVA